MIHLIGLRNQEPFHVFQVEHDHRQLIRRSQRGYMQEVVSESYKGNPKKFWSYIKNAGQEATGVSPLNNEDVFLWIPKE